MSGTTQVVTAPDRASSPTIAVAPMRLDRVAGVSVERLDFSLEVRGLLEQVERCATACAEASVPLDAEIFALVPACPSGVRRVLLRVKRQVHNGVAVDDELDAVRAAGVPDAVVAHWLHERRLLDAAETRLAEAIVEANLRTADQLRQIAAEPNVARALPLMANEFALRIGSDACTPGSRTGRTAVLYAARASVKPSPLSSLTAVNLYPHAPSERRRTAVPVGLASRLLAALSSDRRFLDAFDYAPAQRLGDASSSTHVVTSTLWENDGFLWRNERVVDARAHGDEVRQTAELAGRGAVIAGTLDAVDGRARVIRLVRTGLLVATPPWAVGADTPLRDLARALSRSAHPDAANVVESLVALQDTADRMCDADAATRRRLADEVRERADRATVACGARRWATAVVHEDVQSAVPVGTLPATLEQDLREFAAHLRPSYFRSHVYDVVVEQFRAQTGGRGSRLNAAEFFLALATNRAFLVGARRATMEDLRCEPVGSTRSYLQVGRTSAPPAAAVLYQLAARSAHELAEGDYQVVVNQLGSPWGGMVARFGPLLGRETVNSSLMTWLGSQFPGCDVRSMTLGADVNGLQHAGAGHLPSVDWPSERPGQVGGLTWSDLWLTHADDTGTLEFRDHDGGLVAPVYTGIVPAHLCNGPARYALTVMDPWVDGSVITRGNHPLLRSQQVCDQLTVSERESAGRVVTSRRRWTLPVAEFPDRAVGEDDRTYLTRLDRWRRGAGLPHEVFLLAVGNDPLDSQRRKPMWLDLASLHSVAACLPLVHGANHVRLEEVLPSRDQTWLHAADGRRACEHVSFLAWERPDGGDRP